MSGWSLTHYARPWTANQERNLHHYEKARRVKEWREAFYMLALAAKVPSLQAIAVTVELRLRSARSMPDVGACFPAVKAAVDGLVDAGVIPDDGPAHLHRLTFIAPAVHRSTPDHVILTIEESAVVES